MKSGRVGAGVGHETRSRRVELDVALTGEKIAVVFDLGGAEAAFERGAGSPIGAVAALDLAETETLHQAVSPARSPG